MSNLEDRIRVRQTFRFGDETFPAGAEYEVIAVSPSAATVELIRVDAEAPVGGDSQVVDGVPESVVSERFSVVDSPQSI